MPENWTPHDIARIELHFKLGKYLHFCGHVYAGMTRITINQCADDTKVTIILYYSKNHKRRIERSSKDSALQAFDELIEAIDQIPQSLKDDIKADYRENPF